MNTKMRSKMDIAEKIGEIVQLNETPTTIRTFLQKLDNMFDENGIDFTLLDKDEESIPDHPVTNVEFSLNLERGMAHLTLYDENGVTAIVDISLKLYRDGDMEHKLEQVFG
ncbi:uncharacterized protein LOC119674900 [Teleopsis dalmanni]|uniref:uncharacterized protein LOC119674882 n=1 Tax=Teleopsis dalmanni TaxID=139649 RepID=UPI0018CF4621|nr:uncharacterized protein LOC119674882 [Teleopsis dalmanni]XP_037941988.1 uncharacterized protein LOC119674900 [Teleopsis dalmanni]